MSAEPTLAQAAHPADATPASSLVGSAPASAGGRRAVAGRFDAVVLGAGMSGLVATAVLLADGAGSVLVIDEYAAVGGNHVDHTTADYTFDVGSFIFQDDSPLLAHFPELLERYVPIDPSWAKLTPQGTVAVYPFSLRQDLLDRGPVECARILGSVLRARIRRRDQQTAGDFARYWLGSRLFHGSGLDHYMERFCGLPADRIDMSFARSRMMWIPEHASVRGVVRAARRTLARRPPPTRTNRQMARPRDGFAALYRPVQDRLASAGATFLLGERPAEVRRVVAENTDEAGFRVTVGGCDYAAGRVLSTVPLDLAAEICGLVGPPLPTVTLITAFFSFSGERGFAESILYNFTPSAHWKRLTMYSDFYGRSNGREYFAVEVISAPGVDTVTAGAAEFERHVHENGLFRGNLRSEGGHVLEHAYPVYTRRSAETAQRTIADLRRIGVESFGRQGGFRYQPTARVSAQEAEQAVRQG